MSGKAVRETLGFIGVVASMVFVGLEIQQNTVVARGQTRQELATLQHDWLTLMSQDPDFLDLWQRAWSTEFLAELTPEESARASFMMFLNLRRLENVFFQYDEGLVDQTALSTYGFQATALYETERFGTWWAGSRAGFHPDFVTFFSERMRL